MGTPSFNGNISSMTWKTDLTERGYRFTYDGLSRLMNATYSERRSLTIHPNRFNEQVTGYDRNGNILGLKRFGQTSENDYGLIDDLAMTYNGNQLKAVNDNAVSSAFGNGFEFKDGTKKEVEYSYDANGNLTQDLNKKITDIQYNCLNLPSRIQFENGSTFSYLYDAAGTKRRVTHNIEGKTTTTDYCGNAIYENGVLHKLLTEQGYITLPDTTYHYFIQDHQGNNRVVVDQNGTVEEVNHYYPFGGVFASSQSVQPYKYNGKELDRNNGLDWYDYGARHYDPALGRWHVIDPLSEKYYSTTPYMYCIGTPNNAIDFQGKLVIFINGMHNGSGGTGAYWGEFANRAMHLLNDNNSLYRDGALGGFDALRDNPKIMNANYRIENGYAAGLMDAGNIVQMISDKNGDIRETVKVLTHSMGAAYAKGYVQALKEYFLNHNISLNNIAFEMDFAPFQPTKQSAVDGIDTYQVTNLHDEIANNKLLGSPHGSIQGATVYFNDDVKKGHSITDFLDELWRLPAGSYRVDKNGKIIKNE